MLGTLPQTYQRYVRPLARGRRCDLSHRNRTGDHLVAETLHDRCEQPKPIELLVRNQDP
jgi:hypothetical protein